MWMQNWRETFLPTKSFLYRFLKEPDVLNQVQTLDHGANTIWLFNNFKHCIIMTNKTHHTVIGERRCSESILPLMTLSMS